ncbi:MAG: prepilin-type N-terminal cleavage/methylation domain-containing protein [Proteobacteria bacterium]|nr:prepilin-type N-terminal cleavage/methylation domain-containing protein [Pseudomonadota bacterium]MBU1709560.1 prepilin-type N-terminal cleavage/methylation domain-containing protein [Pseudomonadota bacterium]
MLDHTKSNYSKGFSLIELIVVMVIIGILATQVVFSFTRPLRKVKSTALQLRSDINLARAEAANRAQAVTIDFFMGTEDGYRLCIDTGAAGCADDCPGPGCIKEVSFRREVQFYDANATNGPDRDAGVGTNRPAVGSDGVDFPLALPGVDNKFLMQPNGTASEKGAIFIYAPEAADHTVMLAVPLRVGVEDTSGRVWVEIWDRGTSSFGRK